MQLSERLHNEIKAMFSEADENNVSVKTRTRQQLGLEDDGQVSGVLNFADEQEVIGTPGTLIRDGQIRVEQARNARPYKVRGRQSQPGTLEEYYRSQPIIRDSVDSTVEVQMAASRDLQTPEEDKLPDGVSPEAMEEWTHTLESYFKGIEGGLRDGYVFDAIHSVALFGFAPFEVVWATGDGEPMPFPVKLAYREVSTVHEWVFNDRMDTLVAAEFKTGGDDDREYTLTAVGENLTDRRLIVPRVSGRGNNVEGVAPARSSLHWIRFKRLLSKIQAAAAQVYGMPSRNLTVDPDLLAADFKEFWQATEVDIDQAIEDYDKAEAVEAVVNYLPPPLRVEVANPDNAMPSLLELIRYCDEMIARPFSNEGSLLGHEQIGSYALAEVQDNKFLRSAAPYHRAIMAPIQQLTTLMTRQRFDDPRLLAVPTWEFQLPGRESTELIQSLSTAMGKKPATSWPEPLQKLLTDFFGIEPDAFQTDDEPDEIVAPSADGTPPEEQPAPGEQPDEGGDGEDLPFIEHVRQPDDEGGATDPSSQGGEPDVSESMLACFQEFEKRAPALEEKMDEAEDRLGRAWDRVADRQRETFVSRTQGVDETLELQSIAEDVRTQYASNYRQAAREVSDRLQREGTLMQLREAGIAAPDSVEDIRAPELPPTLRSIVNGTVDQAAEQINRRNTSHMVDQRIEQVIEAARGGNQGSVDKLAAGTMIGAAGAVSGRSINAGRTALITNGLSRLEEQTGVEQAGARQVRDARGMNTRRGVRGVTAVRTSMLDDNVCDNCYELDFQNGGPEYVFGSARYYRDLPPQPCLGGRRCRCGYIHDIDDEQAAALAEYVDANLVL